MLLTRAHRIYHALLLVAWCPVELMAAEVSGSRSSAAVRSAKIGADDLNSGYLVQLVVGLVFVLLCIVALAWVAKRVNRLQCSSDGSLQVLGGISMGARERVVLVQVGNEQLLLGVAPGRINMLHQLEQPLEQADNGVRGMSDLPIAKGFAEKLNSALSRYR